MILPMEEKGQEAFEEGKSGTAGDMLSTPTAYIMDTLDELFEVALEQQVPQILLHDVAKIASEYDPIDLAHAVTRLPRSARAVVYENLPDLNAKIIFMINTGSNTRAAIFRQISDKEIVTLLEGMPPDEAAALLDDMSDRQLKGILEKLSPKKAARIIELRQHAVHTAGRMMTNEFFAFPMDRKISEVAKHIRDNPGIDMTDWIFVLNDERELIGFVPIRNLIVNPPFLPIRQVMGPILHKVTPDASRDEVVETMERYKIPALPVVDSDNHLAGVIAYEDAVEAMKDLADETIANIAGTGEDISEHEPTVKRFLWRTPWLFVTLCAGLTTATFMSYFKDMAWFAFASFFVPLINGMSGNVGIQVSTLLVRGISTGEISQSTRWEAIAKEFVIGLMIGLSFGVLCGAIVFLLSYLGVQNVGHDPLAVGTVVSAGLLSACLTATLLGSISPFFFAKMRIDPAVASGPIVTAFNDVFSTLMYLSVASLVNSYFPL